MVIRNRFAHGATAIAFGTFAFWLLPVSVHAASVTANLSVSATVVNNCTVTTAPLAFGTYDPVVANGSTSLDGTGSVTIACTKGATSTVGLNLGGNASGSTRRLGDGASNFLTYEVYKEAARANVWGNTGADLYSPGVAPSKTPRTLTVYGRIVGDQDIPAGSYTDSTTATVNF